MDDSLLTSANNVHHRSHSQAQCELFTWILCLARRCDIQRRYSFRKPVLSLCRGVAGRSSQYRMNWSRYRKLHRDSSSILVDADRSRTGHWWVIKKEREIGNSVANWTWREMTNNRSGRCWSSCSLSSVRLWSLEKYYRFRGLNRRNSLCWIVWSFSCVSIYKLKIILEKW